MKCFLSSSVFLFVLMTSVGPAMAASSVVEHFRLGVGVGVAKATVKESGQPNYKVNLPAYLVNVGYALNPVWEVGVMVSGSARRQTSNGLQSISVRLEPKPSVYVRARKFINDKVGAYGLISLANVRQRAIGVNNTSNNYIGLGLGAGVTWKVAPKYMVDAGLFIDGIALSSKQSALSTSAHGLMVSINYAFGENESERSYNEDVQGAVLSDTEVPTAQAFEVTEPVVEPSEVGQDLVQSVPAQEVAKKSDWIMHLDDVNFSFDGYTLNAESKLIMDQIVVGLQEAPSLVIGIVAHTDDVGSKLYNLQLSFKREEAVKAYLIEHGIDASRINSKGYGEFVPVSDNTTEEGRLKNRRVEFRVIE